MLADAVAPASSDPDLVRVLVAAVGALAGVIVVLFWQLLSSKAETLAAKAEVTAAYKEILPVTTTLLQTVTAMQKIVDRDERRPTP